MKFKKLISPVIAAAMMTGLAQPLSGGISDIPAAAADKAATDYSYEITPMLSPFNQYFYVKTDNPDPLSFRFVDKSSVYAQEGSYGSIDVNYDTWDEEYIIYADVDYEDASIGRVKGGYIFSSSDTDGGEVTLQYKKDITYSEYNKLYQAGDYSNIGEYTETTSSSSGSNVGFKTYRITGYYKWEDTAVKINLARLVNSIDYLVETYATKNSFFDNMSSVQSGLDSICLYSGSYVRGEVYRANEYWFLSNSPHIDQAFYIQQPYRRKDNRSLLASAIYPYMWDSYSFPRAMGSVANKLSSEAAWQLDGDYHWLIDVTYNGETHSYGGAGSGKGVGIDENQILKRFSFANGAEKLELASSKELLNKYSALEISDDYPHYDDLTWDQVLEKTGTAGSWVRLYSIYSVYGASGTGYSYIYNRSSDGTSLGYVSDGWIDGRYINRYEIWEPGAKLADHPTSSITLTNIEFFETDPYYREVTPVVKNVKYAYNEENDRWEADTSSYLTSGWWISGKVGYDYLKQLADEGKFDAKYLKNMILTREQVEKIADSNTSSIPKKGYIYDGSTDPGTPFLYGPGDVNCDGSVSVADVLLLQQYLAKWNVSIDAENSDVNDDNSVTIADVLLLQQYLAKWNVTLK